jgi:serine/threonine-protein kinase
MSDETRVNAGEGPSLIGRYQITGTLGFGAMGAVYKAFDPLIKRTLAVKTIRLDIPPGSPQHRAFKERFYQEARISGTLSHPNIVTLFDIGEENEVPFLAMEFVEGKTIAAVLEEGARFKPEKVIGLVSQVAAALDYAHSRGVVHRDIKPSNLIVYETDKVKVTDFGIAKLADSEITHSGALLGTPSYMSPEQAMGEKLDGRSDIFSLGVVAFEMLSGQQPFPGANVTSILYKLVHVDPVEPGDLEMNGLVPQKWREVFHKVLAKKPENRYQTASEFVQDLEYCLGSWFTGIGDEATVTLQVPATQPSTVTIPPVAQVPAAPGGGSAEQQAETLLLPRPAPAVPPADTAASEATTVLQAERSIEDLVEVPTVLMAPPGAGQSLEATTVLPPVAAGTLPPEPTLRDVPTTAETAVLPTSRRGVPVGWALGGVAAVAVVALGIVAFALAQRPRPAAPAPESTPAAESPAPLPTLGALRVESEPAGAGVRLNGKDRGRTPLQLADLPFGIYEVKVELKGYEAQARDVSLHAGSPLAEVKVALARPAAAPTGAADVVSTPAGATVTVDGRAVGRTPLAGLKLRPGRRRIAIALDQHETWTGTVDVAAGETGRVEVRLRPQPKAIVPPTPPPVDTARVYANTPADVDTPAKKLSGSSPSYPSDRAGRLKSGERVSVVIRFLVTEAGEVQDVTVVESGGKAVDEVVVSAVRTWKYQPARKQGTPVKVQVLFKQTFLGG